MLTSSRNRQAGPSSHDSGVRSLVTRLSERSDFPAGFSVLRVCNRPDLAISGSTRGSSGPWRRNNAREYTLV